MDNVRAVGGGYYTVKPDSTVHSWRYNGNIMNQYTRGFSDIRLTDIATPVSKPAAGAAGRTAFLPEISIDLSSLYRAPKIRSPASPRPETI